MSPHRVRPFGDPHATRRSLRHGQSLAEFAVILPVFLVLVLFAVDFGRAFLSVITLNNASRIAANFAGQHPEGVYSNPTDPVNVEFEAIVGADTAGAFCSNVTLADPVYMDGSDSGTGDSARNVGDSVRVSVSCAFQPLTPIISGIVGTGIDMSASSEFDVRSGEIIGAPEPVFVEPPAPSPSPPPSPAPSSGPSPSPSPPPACSGGQLVVPDFLGPPADTIGEARAEWLAAGFTGPFHPSSGKNNKVVQAQSIPGNTCAPSTSTMTVTHQ